MGSQNIFFFFFIRRETFALSTLSFNDDSPQTIAGRRSRTKTAWAQLACTQCLEQTPRPRGLLMDQAFDFSIVDKVVVPELPPGDYVLGFRLDAEQSSQVWSICSDVTVVAHGANTKPFSPTNGCHACCPQTKSICSNCTGCLNDKTGPCAYCWEPLHGFAPNNPSFHCLGFEAEDGTAPEWHFGDDYGGWSPGCPRCWSDEAACQEHFRPLEDEEIAV